MGLMFYVFHLIVDLKSKPFECRPQQLIAIGNRLLDWFSVIMADTKKQKRHTPKSKGA